MSAPLIWVIMPIISSIILWGIRGRRTASAVTATGFCFVFALLALVLPVAQGLNIGQSTIHVSSTLSFLGRKLVIDDSDRSLLVLIFTIGAFWFAGAPFAGIHRFFIPLAMSMLAFFVAALSVDPFLYAALLIEVCVLLSIPLLSPPGRQVTKGVLRYLIFQSMAIPFILFAGWALGGIEVNPSDTRLITLAIGLLALGFALWLAVFPFYTWMPLLAEQSHPYAAGFVLMLLPTIALVMALNFVDSFAWLRENPRLSDVLRLSGTMMVVTGGVWAAFQKNLARVMGYAVIVESGYSLLAISLGLHPGIDIFIMMFLPRIWGLGLWALSLTVLQTAAGVTTLSGARGLLRKFPIASTGLILANLSLAGLPLLSGFPLRQMLLRNLATQNQEITVWVLVGSACLFIGAFRTMASLVSSESVTWEVNETQPLQLLLLSGIAAVIGIGLFPSWFLPGLLTVIKAFTHLQ